MAIEFLHSDVERAIIAYQAKVSSTLNFMVFEKVQDCVELGVSYGELEMLLCVTLARYELIPRQIEVEDLARRGDDRARRELVWIKSVLAATNRNADQREMVFNLEDPTRVRDEVFAAHAVVLGHFEDAPAARRKLRAKLGIPLKRLRMLQGIAKRATVGYCAAALWKRFEDAALQMQGRLHAHIPRDPLIADLLNAVLPDYITANDVQHCRLAYAKLQG